ncbi:hypothetical protein SCOR_16060 [Sulfidibacter corallicola]|uniref:Lipoprotein n=1 Tax=Sulfidibacter corallicola TaxID=2818388 RepID=A0A8A4TVQ8_SULCO|nr:hypothetical protein [Sulfidibacter corallicola]QTD54019.1 hypothetical protein J3U87_16355 [Sulfidibacter corallicola]
MSRKAFSLVLCLLSIGVLFSCKTGTNTRLSGSGSQGASGDFNFVIRMYGDFPAKFKNKNIHILVEGRRVESRKSTEPLRELRFSLDKKTVDAAVSSKEGPDAKKLDVSVRLEPLDWEGKEETLAVVFDIREKQPEYVASWGTGRMFEDDPVQSEDTHQKTRIN